jgi:ElaB/YqjD/DUF883 family membrane-anchored ribosome-binding protein
MFVHCTRLKDGACEYARAMEKDMAQAYESRTRRNGALRTHAKSVRDDVSTLQKDFSQLRNDLGTLAAMQWSDLRGRTNDSARYVGEQVRQHPATAIGIAAGAGLLAGLALSAMGNGRTRAH